MSETEARAAYIEIVERQAKTADTPGGSIIVPDEIRINGIPILIPEGQTIKIHEMTLGQHDQAMLVTLTLFARQVVIAAEHDIVSIGRDREDSTRRTGEMSDPAGTIEA